MLLELTIENFAIIDRLTVHFDPGLTVITGETGAGKSIVIDALQAALGARTPADVVRSGARGAVVEAVFDCYRADQGGPLSSLLGELGIETDDVLVLRREIGATGRAVARVNGRALPVSSMQALGALLVDIHGQSEHLSILRRDRQLEVLDRFGELMPLRGRVAAAVADWRRSRQELEALVAGRREVEQQRDLLRFQVEEITGAQLVENEEEDLEAEHMRLANAEKLAHLSGIAYEILNADDGGVLESLRDAMVATHEVAGIDTLLTGVDQRLEAARIDLEDIAAELRRYRDEVANDPERLSAVEDRLDILSRLRRKYGATIPEVIRFGEQARKSLTEAENVDERIAELEAGLEAAAQAAGDLVGQLSQARRRVADKLSSAMSLALGGLGLHGTKFEVGLTQTSGAEGLDVPACDGRYAVSASGIDDITFLVSFNQGEAMRPIEKVASGGETSRFLLALKSVLASADQVPTLVFDEVDVGVGARHGAAVGERLRELAESHQVLSITHLPQVAALANHHFTVRKSTSDHRTIMDMRTLDESERVGEIAAMMTGSETEIARQNARELLALAQRP